MTPSKVRIYDLAKELKQESKRIMEEVRREGVDVSVPSNTISKELAEKIRNKYFPKKEVSAPRAVRVVKKAARHIEAEEHPAEAAGKDAVQALAPEPSAEPDARAARKTSAPSAEQPSDQAPGTASKPFTARLVKKLAPAQRAEQPATPSSMGAAALPQAETPGEQSARENFMPPSTAADTADDGAALPMSAQEQSFEAAPSASADAPPASAAMDEVSHLAPAAPAASGLPPGAARQVRVLRPTTAALNAGIRHGERAPAPIVPAAVPAAPSPRERDRRSGSGAGEGAGGGRREEHGRDGGRSAMRGGGAAERTPRGTPGENLNPQTTYIPPADARRPGGRPGSRRGNVRGGHGRGSEGKGGRFEKDFLPPPRALTPEQRLAATLGMTGDEAAKQVRLVEGSTVKEFAEKLGIKPKDVVSVLLQRGIFATVNQTLDDAVAVDLGKRFGFDVSFVPFEEMVTEEEFEELIATDVAGGEAGGITQHIGAYSVNVPSPDNAEETRRVVFLDTPGHEAFTMMRARGAKATDVVVLVVAADDGVMPQTIEAIEHSRAANVPIVVAINKIDRPDANPDRVRQELSAQGLQPVEWGGDVEMVLVSAKRRENLDALLETILLTTDILELRASPTRLASGVVLEAKLDRGRGAVATVLVQQGTLHVGDPFIVGQIFGKVRAMFSDRGEPIDEAGPATPVEVLGLQGVPQAGESFQVVADVTRAQQISHQRQMQSRQSALLQTTKRGIEALGEKEVKELLVVVKADVQGSVEVLKSTLQKLSTEQVKVKVIRSGVGAITESDVLLASATQAGASGSAVVIIGFNVRPEARASELAKQESVDIRLHSIIYKVEEEIRAAMIGMLEAIEKERIIGTADVREVFRVPRLGAVAGSMVKNGVLRRTARARLIRDGVVAWEGGIASLRRFKDDVSEVREGFECGIGLENFNDIKVGDQIEAYVIEKVADTEL